MVWQASKVTWLVPLYCQWEPNALDVSSIPWHKIYKGLSSGDFEPSMSKTVCGQIQSGPKVGIQYTMYCILAFGPHCIFIMNFCPCLVWGTYSCILYTHCSYALYTEKPFPMYCFYCNFLRGSKSLAGGCVQCYLTSNLNGSD